MFEAMWTARNNTLHGEDSHLIEREDGATISRLLQFHRECELLLSLPIPRGNYTQLDSEKTPAEVTDTGVLT